MAHLEMSPKCLTVANTAVFSASEQIHYCALVVCESECVTVDLHSAF